MTGNRIKQHPILEMNKADSVTFFWKGDALIGKCAEMISSALIANNIFIFGHHQRDNSPQSLFCANGQCSQCMVIADGMPVKACITLLKEGMRVEPVEELITLQNESHDVEIQPNEKLEIPVLIIGGGPAGLSAAIELARENVDVLLVDDKPSLGGKLLLQTHRFFGASDAVYAGTRGNDIAKRLSSTVSLLPSFTGWTNSTALAIFSDKKVGILKNGTQYIIVKPSHILIATGAREKSLCFLGNTLPGVLGAGAFQTLVNRDLVSPGKNICIVGGGNVGLIAGYHALQAGISVAGLIEFLPVCSGYKVHQDNLKRLGVPFFLSHTILSANGSEHVESITIAEINSNNEPIPITQKTLPCDCLLIAVGLNPVNEFYQKALEFGLCVEAAGDAEEIAEASAAMVSGKIKAKIILNKLMGTSLSEIAALNVQKVVFASKPGAVHSIRDSLSHAELFPVFHCIQEIPCDPCVAACPLGLIKIDQKDIRNLPFYNALEVGCSGCMSCVAKCPGHAVILVDFRSKGEHAFVSLPYEFDEGSIKIGQKVTITDIDGNELCIAPVISIISRKAFQLTKLIKVQVDKQIAKQAAGFRILQNNFKQEIFDNKKNRGSKNIICRCERISKEEIQELIREGHHDINEIKALTRAGMGACGGKTCQNLILQLIRQETSENNVIMQTSRPLFCEVPLSVFAGVKGKESKKDG
jgi:sarcosine oxidase, subunit alpha